MAFFKENRKIFLEATFALLFIGLAIFFIRHERAEIHDVRNSLANAHPLWIVAGILMTGFYIFMQGLLYFNSFRSVQKKVNLGTTIKVFLKRNFIGVFLPAGGIASLAMFTNDFKHYKISKTGIHFASSIYAFTSILTVVLISIPVLTWAIIRHNISSNQIVAFIVVCLIVGGLIYIFVSILRKGFFFRLIIRFFPRLEGFFIELESITINKVAYAETVVTSLLIELTGILHLIIAAKALGFDITLEGAILGYVTSVLVLVLSPFLKGLGAIELSMAFVLTRFGFSTVDAISITLLYRFFEFWLPLAIGGMSFVFVRNSLVLRVIPAVMTFLLGIINIISVLTPDIQSRVNVLLEFVPHFAIHFSNYFVFTTGLFLLVISAFLLKGLKTTWYIALLLALFSMIGHLVKAIDYEEALLAGFVSFSLIMTRKEYFVKPHPRWGQIGIVTALASMIAVMTYGTIGFYYLDKKFFNIDFSILQSITYSIENFFLFRSEDLHSTRKFANDFLSSINIAGFLSLSFLLYTLVRSYVHKPGVLDEERQRAMDLIKKHGRSTLDYFKTYDDKLYFFTTGKEGFISYKIAGNYATVLENPVCSDEESLKFIVRKFDDFCQDNGLKSFYFRVPEEYIPTYYMLDKKSLLIGQEAIIDLRNFTLEGGTKKSIRNACNKMLETGYFSRLYLPPVKEGVLQKIKAVSTEWLEDNEFHEMVFSQGMFRIEELQQHTVMTIENKEEKVVAFLNIIPDFAPGEVTFDLIRKTKDAPNGTIDFLMIETINYLRSRGYQFLNLGFAPMSGIEKGRDFPEKSIKFAYEKIRTFSAYHGLRDFKDKFGPDWKNRYIIYDHHYDLFNIPSILAKVVKP
ncbi:MAG: phosphatidylglycerol lysyltransferase domain-containing protein [Bacteroidetes bacterium]|nr:phosphatidylglycerol lysyltransferase domain-containing protein [Bacteroidota bacterium]